MTNHHQLLLSLNTYYRARNCEKAVQFFRDFIKNLDVIDADENEELFLDVIAMTKLWIHDDETSSCHIIQGMALQELKQFDKAVVEFEHAIRLK